MGQTSSTPRGSASAGCPVDHKAATGAGVGGCPVPHDGPSKSSPKLAQCPIDHESISPLNQMPQNLSQSPAPSQALALPTSRTISSIPRGDTDTAERWEYPSAQQFYNALMRKGKVAPGVEKEELEHVETMVEIHNFLNERAWEEVVRWERRVGEDSGDDIQLARFKGRPGEMSPKARIWQFAGWLMPSRFNTEPPFDRHDWIVRRPKTGEEVRYVIDYYSAPPEPDGSPVFSLDVRPALDSFGSLKERIAAATEDAWAALRENNNILRYIIFCCKIMRRAHQTSLNIICQ
ncbi:Cytochrome c heme lyase [Mycena venus]|uniref:Holocytochrome c-type synthase n=1 Tax=Mycena venus TaxID=2733690 RepID=A0A8H6Y8L0_9AGAR|nr:Cytochrome c heme lyase [Mycena venus]